MAPRNSNIGSALKFITRDGHVYSGDTAFQVVDAMRADSVFTSEKSLDGYMRTAAERYKRFDEIIVRSDTPENFIADLVASGSLTKGS